MGYTITIGNATPQPPDPSDAPGGSFGWTVASLVLPEAPHAPNDVNGGANYRWPSYSVWADFARDVGLHDMFFDKDGEASLMLHHPGIAPLSAWHREQTAAALAAYRKKHPTAVARFADPVVGGRPFGTVESPMDGPNAALARLEWLDWWIGWALANCQHPALGNS